jgi:hypothetical protein
MSKQVVKPIYGNQKIERLEPLNWNPKELNVQALTGEEMMKLDDTAVSTVVTLQHLILFFCCC